MTVLRHAVALFLLPFMVTVAVPIWIARRNGVALSRPTSAADLLLAGAGIAAAVVGLALFVSSVYSFATRGHGTLAPWDPPRQLVVQGPYRFVRNPMISGVMFILAAEALLLRSLAHAGWAAAIGVVNAIYIPLVEEPMLAARFGRAYAEYAQSVGRFVPRLTPWRSPNISD